MWYNFNEILKKLLSDDVNYMPLIISCIQAIIIHILKIVNINQFVKENINPGLIKNKDNLIELIY